MGERDNRYNSSVKGKARQARFESKPERKRYQAAWVKAKRARLKARNP